jgi:mRNA deadenylase 3'-5' endonuclease subunit Ccr4
MTFEAKWWNSQEKNTHSCERNLITTKGLTMSETLKSKAKPCKFRTTEKKTFVVNELSQPQRNIVTHNNNKKALSDCMMKQHKNNIMVWGIMLICNKKPIAKCASLH